MAVKTQLPRGYSKDALPPNHSAKAKGKCPECGFPYVMKFPTENSVIYAHRNEWYHQVFDDK